MEHRAEGVEDMIKAVLFDLDDTLLDINLIAFVARYALGQARILARATRTPLPVASCALTRAYLSIDSQTRRDGLTNAQLFEHTLSRRLGTDVSLPELQDALAFYDEQCVPRMQEGLVSARPRKGAQAILDAARSLGLTVALATNPCFTPMVDKVRLSWADLDPTQFAHISHLENSSRTKPSAHYYQEFITHLGLTPQECLMVGNDASRDFPRPACGLATAYVGHGFTRKGVYAGHLRELARRLPEVIDRLNAQSVDEACPLS